MARRRRNDVDFNFDGLTDSITNLAGSLVLLVVLVFAITKPKERGMEEAPLANNTVGAETPMDALVERIAALKSDAAALARDTDAIGSRLPDLAGEVESLETQARPARTP